MRTGTRDILVVLAIVVAVAFGALAVGFLLWLFTVNPLLYWIVSGIGLIVCLTYIARIFSSWMDTE